MQNRRIVIGVIPDPNSVDREVQADIFIEVEPGRIDDVASELGEHEEVGYLAVITGNYNLSAAVFVATHAELLEFCETVISKIPGIKRVVPCMILHMYKVFGTRTTALNRMAKRKAE